MPKGKNIHNHMDEPQAPAYCNCRAGGDRRSRFAGVCPYVREYRQLQEYDCPETDISSLPRSNWSANLPGQPCSGCSKKYRNFDACKGNLLGILDVVADKKQYIGAIFEVYLIPRSSTISLLEPGQIHAIVQAEKEAEKCTQEGDLAKHDPDISEGGNLVVDADEPVTKTYKHTCGRSTTKVLYRLTSIGQH
ncbi:hypothetical protein AcV5_005754 [Taiwanofungus camphoratus]|nr:hypothetical protein AcV5_005754 [Antrodia cinnamomea]